MANAKILQSIGGDSGVTVYGMAVYITGADAGKYLNSATGAFVTPVPAPPNCYVTMTEDASIKGLYTATFSSATWTDGRIMFVSYVQAGGSPAPSTDTKRCVQELTISGDTDVSLVEVDIDLDAIIAAVGAIPTTPLLTGDTRLNRLDADITSRASQTSVSAIPTTPLLTTDTRLNRLDADISSRASQTSVSAIPTTPLLATDGRIDTLDLILAIVTLLKKYVRNKKEIVKDGGTGVKSLVIYDDDGTTEIIRKSLKDQTGADISDLVAGTLAVEGASNV